MDSCNTETFRQSHAALTAACRRGFVVLSCGSYFFALCSFWSLLTRQHYLPYHPLAFVLYSGGLLAISSHFVKNKFAVSTICRRVPLPAFVAGIEFFIALAMQPFWVNGGKSETNLLRAVLNLTKPGDYVIDRKGDTVFRQRCVRPVLERFSLERIRRGLDSGVLQDHRERWRVTGMLQQIQTNFALGPGRRSAFHTIRLATYFA